MRRCAYITPVLFLVWYLVAPSTVVTAPPTQSRTGYHEFAEGDYLRAFELAVPLADQGITEAQCLAGSLSLTGLGGSRDERAAEEWLRAAGEKGCGLSWHNLSNLYRVGGENIPADKEEGQRCRQKAIENGFDLEAEFPWMMTQFYADALK